MKESIVSKPDNDDAGDINSQHQFEYFETKGRRPEQGDALAWHVLPDGALQNLTPREIGLRFWTSYRVLDQMIMDRRPDYTKTAASTTLYDGRGNLITVTTDDAVSFAAVYDKEGKVRGVARLNHGTHSASDPIEVQRIKEAEGYVIYDRTFGRLAVPLAVSDSEFKLGASPYAIDIIRCEDLVMSSGLNPDELGQIRVITSCDGFTEKAPSQTKAGHEQYLLAKLTAYQESENKGNLAHYLANQAIADGSEDNVSVSVQALPGVNEAPFALLQGVYDGHGEPFAAQSVARNIGRVFLEQCQLTPEQYADQKFSVTNFQDIFQQDNLGRWHEINHSTMASSSRSSPGDEGQPAQPKAAAFAEQLKIAISAAQTRYADYHRLSRTDKENRQELNRGQGDGRFSFFRHLSSGLVLAQNWSNRFSSLSDDEAAKSSLIELLEHPKTRYHRHSFGSFVLDELSKIFQEQGVAIQPNAQGVYENVPDLIRSIDDALGKPSPSR